MAFVLDALEHARYARQPERNDALVHYSNRDAQYGSIRYCERLGDAGIQPSVVSTVDSNNNAFFRDHQRVVQGRIDTDIAVLPGKQASLSSWPL